MTRDRRAETLARYGLTVEQYNQILEGQGGVCALCRQPERTVHAPSRGNAKVRSLSVDHDHRTGRIRGLLCRRCNGNLMAEVDGLLRLHGERRVRDAIEYALQPGA